MLKFFPFVFHNLEELCFLGIHCSLAKDTYFYGESECSSKSEIVFPI